MFTSAPPPLYVIFYDAELGRRRLLLAIERLTWFLRRRWTRLKYSATISVQSWSAPDRVCLKRDLSPVHICGDEQLIATPGELKGFQVLLYSGNYGVVHDSDTVVRGLIKHYSEGTGSFGL